jgi:hypothetical protein
MIFIIKKRVEKEVGYNRRNLTKANSSKAFNIIFAALP